MEETTENTPVIWVLLDDRAGNINQAAGVAEALGVPCILKNIRYNKWVKLPNFLRKRTLHGINLKDSDKLSEPWPEIVIAAGRRLAPVARHIKKQAEGRCILVQMMWPGWKAGDFDFIAVPTHDNLHMKPNLVKTLGAPNRINGESLKQAAAMWRKTLLEKAPPPPYIALLVGGDTKKGEFKAQHARELGKLASDFAIAKNSTLLISTSRRTSEEAQAALKESITCPNHFHDLAKERANPYIAFLALSDSIIVTGDSISMCSEACSTGKPVLIYTNDDFTPSKHKKLHRDLYKAGYALQFTVDNLNNCNHLKPPPLPLQEAEDIARRIKELYFD